MELLAKKREGGGRGREIKYETMLSSSLISWDLCLSMGEDEKSSGSFGKWIQTSIPQRRSGSGHSVRQ
jgi:hypothetical protein